ncbi:MAG: Uncharacterized protein G01um101413_604 [Parcubacteria group bacterium Gr01-1014_13]|nr:MAG: Uncharacterized protein G01um101413_604 [Parcubacteria group bacterium Gr01-1014_13]
MPAFLNFLPNMSLLETIINIVALLGAILLTYGVFLEAERRQDAVFMVGSACLLVYSLWIGNKIFSLAMVGLFIGSLIELIEILIGKHKHIN